MYEEPNNDSHTKYYAYGDGRAWWKKERQNTEHEKERN